MGRPEASLVTDSPGKSRTIRAREAMSFADSIRQTASIVRWVSVAVTATDQTISRVAVQDRPDYFRLSI